jgi:enamine deaminase RidA (YjgF/YER057c/UK114 family)
VKDVLPHPALLVGGTASISGEKSVHHNQLTRQLRETLKNIASLIAAADTKIEESAALERLTHTRVYFPHADAERVIAAHMRAALPRTAAIQFMQADLCRTDLLVEIEGVAVL